MSESKVQEIAGGEFEAAAGQAPGYTVVDFYATWCPHCKSFRPTFEEVAGSYAKPVKFCAADVEQHGDAARKYGVRSIPTVVLLKDGEQVDIHVGGMQAAQLVEWLDAKCE